MSSIEAEKKGAARDDKSKYVLIYAKDIKIPQGAGAENSEMASFRWIGGVLWHLLRHPAARMAIAVGRFQFIKIDRRKKTP